MRSLLSLISSPVTILALAPVVKNGLGRLINLVINPHGTYFLSLASVDNRAMVRAVGTNTDLQIALLAYITYGLGLQSFFQYIVFAYLSISVSFLSYQGNNPLIPRLRIVLYVITTVTLVVVALLL